MSQVMSYIELYMW